MTKDVTVVTYVTYEVPDDTDINRVAGHVRDLARVIDGSKEPEPDGWELLSVEPETWFERPKPSVYVDDIDPEVIKSFLVEAIHGSWDAVPPSDVAAYDRLLADLGTWAQNQ